MLVTGHPTRRHIISSNSEVWTFSLLNNIARLSRDGLDRQSSPSPRPHRIPRRRHPFCLYATTPRETFSTTKHILTTNERSRFPPPTTWPCHPHQNHQQNLSNPSNYNPTNNSLTVTSSSPSAKSHSSPKSHPTPTSTSNNPTPKPTKQKTHSLPQQCGCGDGVDRRHATVARCLTDVISPSCKELRCRD